MGSFLMASSSTEKLFHEQIIPGKGKGLVASKKLLPGTILLTEKPLIVIDDSKTNKFNLLQAIEQFSALSDEEKNVFMDLHDPGDSNAQLFNIFAKDDTEKKILRVFITNCIALCSHEEMNINKSGVYPTISRINHSCAPNVIWSWVNKDPLRLLKQVRVCRTVEPGEELTASYVSNCFMTKAQRSLELKKWKFDCNCEVCHLSGESLAKNEATRLKIIEYHDKIPSEALFGNVNGALKSANNKLKLMKTVKNEMILEIPNALMECCELAAHAKVPKEKTKALREKAGELANQFGDAHIYNFNKKCRKIDRI